MFDRKSPTFEKAREEVEKTITRAKLMKLARKRTDSDPSAEDLVQRALAKVFDPQGSPWNPESGVSFVAHVGSIMNSAAFNERNSARARREVLGSPVVDDGGTADDSPVADGALEEREEREVLRRRGALLYERLGEEDLVARGVLLAAREGIDRPAEHAERLGLAVEDVYAAYRRLKYHARQILEEESVSERETPEGHAGTAAKQEVAR